MSVENAQKFLEKMGSDAAFAAKVKQAKSLEESKKIINGAGFSFTEEELAKAQQGELQDEELDAVAGGGYMCFNDIHDNCGKD